MAMSMESYQLLLNPDSESKFEFEFEFMIGIQSRSRMNHADDEPQAN